MGQCEVNYVIIIIPVEMNFNCSCEWYHQLLITRRPIDGHFKDNHWNCWGEKRTHSEKGGGGTNIEYWLEWTAKKNKPTLITWNTQIHGRQYAKHIIIIIILISYQQSVTPAWCDPQRIDNSEQMGEKRHGKGENVL